MGNDKKNNAAKELDDLERELETGSKPKPTSEPKPAELVKKTQKKEGKRYTSDFKKTVVKEKKNGATYAELYKKHNIYASQIITWSKK